MKLYQKVLLVVLVPCTFVLMMIGLYKSQVTLLQEEGIVMNPHMAPLLGPMGEVVARPAKNLQTGTYLVLSVKKDTAGFEIALKGFDLPCIVANPQVVMSTNGEATFEVVTGDPRQYVLRLPANYPTTREKRVS